MECDIVVKEMIVIKNHSVYEKVSSEECRRIKGREPIKKTWIVIKKGDEDKPEYRIRLVAQEIIRGQTGGSVCGNTTT